VTITPTASLQFQRAVRGLPFEAIYEFELDNDSPPDAAPTYVVTNAEGAEVASGMASLTTSDPIEASFTLTAANLPARDLLTVTWSYTVSTVPVEVTSTIDVCDKRLFPITDYNQFNDKQVTTATPATLEQARREAEDFLERECGCAFTGRYGSEFWLVEGGHEQYYGGIGYDGWHLGRRCGARNELTLRQPFVSVVRSISRAWVDPTTGASGTHALNLEYVQLDAHTSTIHVRNDPTDQYGGLWGELTIGFEHGRPDADVRRVCLILARYRVVNGPLERRAQSMTLEGGGNISLLTPGMAASVTGIPEVDSFLERRNAHVDGFLGG
jgi:hypothetical protein